MARRLLPAITFTAGAAIVGLALSACGSSSLSTPQASKAPTVAQTADAALVAKLPAKIKSAGKMVVGVDATYAPNEFLDADGKTVRARMFAPLSGTFEDAATGSASATLAALRLSLTSDAETRFEIIQGVEMGRPSLLLCAAKRGADGIRATVGGGCVPVLKGEVSL